MKTIALLLALAACSKTNDVTLLLGPDEDRISRGFVCRRSGGSGQPFLMQDVLANGRLRFAFVVDLIELDAEGVFPGCRGEELLSYCKTHDCTRNVKRTCIPDVEVEFPPMFNANDPADVRALVTKLRASLAGRTLMSDVPSSPVIIRVVAVPDCPTAMDIDPATAVGCAYSCPVQLDNISGSVSISLDTFSDNCESEVRACAAFPFRN